MLSELFSPEKRLAHLLLAQCSYFLLHRISLTDETGLKEWFFYIKVQMGYAAAHIYTVLSMTGVKNGHALKRQD